MRKIAVRSRNPMPSSADADHQRIIALWCEVEDYFRTSKIRINGNISATISVSAADIKAMLINAEPNNVSEYLGRFCHDEKMDRSDPFASGFLLEICDEVFTTTSESELFTIRFLETLFLAMNIAAQDGCNLIYSSVILDGVGDVDMHDLSNYAIESAWNRAHAIAWPLLSGMPFSQVWEWLVQNKALSYVLAETPATKAIAALTELSYVDHLRVTDIVQVCHVLESFLLTKDEPRARGIQRKVQAVLGHSARADSWVKKFYKLRSGIAHGEYPIFYPRYDSCDSDFERMSAHYWEVNEILLHGVGVIIGLLQDLIRSGNSAYSFEEKLSFVRLK